jgi:hypothetical protein
VSWALLVDGRYLAAMARQPRESARLDPRPLRVCNRETGEIREWRDGLDSLVSAYDEAWELLGRIAEALGPDVLRRWEDGDEELDLAAEVASLRGIVAGYQRTLDEALNSGDGRYRP